MDPDHPRAGASVTYTLTGKVTAKGQDHHHRGRHPLGHPRPTAGHQHHRQDHQGQLTPPHRHTGPQGHAMTTTVRTRTPTPCSPPPSPSSPRHSSSPRHPGPRRLPPSPSPPPPTTTHRPPTAPARCARPSATPTTTPPPSPTAPPDGRRHHHLRPRRPRHHLDRPSTGPTTSTRPPSTATARSPCRAPRRISPHGKRGQPHPRRPHLHAAVWEHGSGSGVVSQRSPRGPRLDLHQLHAVPRPAEGPSPHTSAAAGSLVVSGSTFVGNQPLIGGAIFSGAVPATVTNSTFYDNHANNRGGAVGHQVRAARHVLHHVRGQHRAS